MFALLGIAIVVSPVMYYLLFIFPLAMMVYICCRSPFQSKWMRAAYFVNCFCILIMLVCNLLIIAFKDTVYYLPFGSLITIMVDWIFNLVVWGREAYVICKYSLYYTGTVEREISMRSLPPIQRPVPTGKTSMISSRTPPGRPSATTAPSSITSSKVSTTPLRKDQRQGRTEPTLKTRRADPHRHQGGTAGQTRRGGAGLA
jgi:hypothetical protein